MRRGRRTARWPPTRSRSRRCRTCRRPTATSPLAFAAVWTSVQRSAGKSSMRESTAYLSWGTAYSSHEPNSCGFQTWAPVSIVPLSASSRSFAAMPWGAADSVALGTPTGPAARRNGSSATPTTTSNTMTTAFSGEVRVLASAAARAVRARRRGRPTAAASESLSPGWSATIATGAARAHQARPRPVKAASTANTTTETIGPTKRAGGRRRSIRSRNATIPKTTTTER